MTRVKTKPPPSARRAAQTQNDPRWARIADSDPGADGQFWYAVRSTGIYCNPSCKSRLPKPENVEFFDSVLLAERAGYRACKRCKPDQSGKPDPQAQAVVEACRQIEASQSTPRLEQLAANAGMSSFHFHRVFKNATGLTPAQYARAQRASRLRSALKAPSATVTDAIYESGFGSGGQFYDRADSILGMTPTDFQKGGSDQVIHFAIGESSLGSVLVASSQRGVCCVLLGDDPEALAKDLQDRFPKADIRGADPAYESVVAQVIATVECPKKSLELPLDIRGTAFQQQVWDALRKIPAGQTATYTQIAQKIGKPKSVRAVAQACAANSIGVAIPCHRVVRRDGSLSGYRWGVERKRELLEREGAL